MMYIGFIRASVASFRNGESGAVTVDWVVLTAAVVGVSIAIFLTLGNGAYEHAELVGETMSVRGVPSY